MALVFSATVHGSDESEPLTVELYRISGSSARELRKELDRLGPVDSDGVRHDGHTQWFITLTYQLDPDADGCEMLSFETKLDITMTLPKWDRSKGAPARLVNQWERYNGALRLHEDGHYDIAVAAAKEIRRRVEGQRGAVDCQALGRDIDATAETVLLEYRRQEVEYDKRTKHGQAQGAQFP